jgi:membrane protein DedA with SNARE-associated domain
MIDAGWSGPWVLLAVFVAAAVEGEAVFVAACAAVAAGHLSAAGVWLAGVGGAWVGDQLWFWILRAGPRRWIQGRAPLLGQTARAWSLVRRHQNLVILAIRFLPGLRVTLTAVCMLAGVSPVRFAWLNLLGAAIWAALLLGGVVWVGPALASQAGVPGWRGAAATGVALVLLLRGLALLMAPPRRRATDETR